MPEYLRALVVILVLATTVFVFAKAPACAMASTTADFERRRNLWFAITLAAFLAHNFWIYIIVTAVLLLMALPREPNRLAMFFFLLFAVPYSISDEISGMGVIRSFFTINYLRLLALTVLLPAFILLWRQPDSERFGRSLPDKILAGYMILTFVLTLSASTFTHALRSGVFYSFIDIFLPYYVASRSLKNLEGFRDTLMGFVVAALVVSTIGAFEFARHWLLYSSLGDVLGAKLAAGSYLERGEGTLRALASMGHPIPLGYVMAVASGFLVYLRRSVPNAMAWCFGVLLILGLIACLSRGPWLGATVMLLVFVATGPSPGKGLLKLGLLGAIILPVLLMTSFGEKIIDLLPWVGGAADDTVTYRQQLLKISIYVIFQNPFFGAFDFMYSPAMQELKQGQGIIDIVNTYVGVALRSGLIGLSLFLGFFIVVAVGIFKGMKNLDDTNSELYILGQVLFSTLIGILVIIFTVSSVSVIPVIYWSVAGISVAYVRMLASEKTPAQASGPAPAVGFQAATLRNR